MVEMSYFWGGTTVGDHGTYTDDQFSILLRALFQDDLTSQGVIHGKLNELAVTNPVGTTIRVASGLAMVDGKLYSNGADVDLTVVAPGGGSNYYTIVLQKDFVTQTIRIVKLGPDAGSPPVVTQTDGVVWEISIATVRITSAGVITVTDTRDFCHFTGMISTDMMDAASITSSLLGSSVVLNSNIANDTITGAKIAASTIGWDNFEPMALPSSDLSAIGQRITLTAAVIVGFGDVVYINASSKGALGDADDEATASCVAMAIEPILANDPGLFLLYGLVRNDAWNWTPGGLIFLTVTGTTGNTLSQTAPTGVNDIVQILGWALSADVMFFNPQMVQVVHA